ncbi:hypothetical protein OXYTRIMIC_495 [Oxytricha trifallax]|uniref:Ubiquitin-like protease family profile domain-containing protein n=1 Tax=Oxytricha trifallax TaxID=1172189 RepID=A0A073HZM7_9SPIT|nr:hypothetical protein OXYTRIMIC_495 [Oxytricha trifallax]
MITVVCCPSSRVRLEKALVRKYEERNAARRRGARERDLWSEKQLEHKLKINEDWIHFDLIPGNHIVEETMESITRLIEELQFSQGKTKLLVLPPMVVNDKGIQMMERSIGRINWKLENGKFWRDVEDITGVIIPLSCQSSMKYCKNWVVLGIERKSMVLEIYDTRRAVGSYAILQRYADQISELAIGVVGRDFRVNKLLIMTETNQVADPVDCGILSALIINHLALELQGEPVFQIFAKDWLNMQRYYLMFNLEVGHNKMEIGRSGMAIQEEEVERDLEKKGELIWQLANEEMGTDSTHFNQAIDGWDNKVMREYPRGDLEQELTEIEGKFSQIIDEASGVEEYLPKDNTKPDQDGKDAGRKPVGKEDDLETQALLGKHSNNMEEEVHQNQTREAEDIL